MKSFLQDFVTELGELLDQGLRFSNKLFIIKIHSFICDAPARAFLKCIKSHSGYSSCEKCEEVGEYINGRVVLRNIFAPLRTDQSFLLQHDEDHHLGVSPLAILNIGLVSKFPIDYMHNVCLGVMRKLLNSWISGPLKVRFRGQLINEISDSLSSFKEFIVVEFNRKPRTIAELARWKATEL